MSGKFEITPRDQFQYRSDEQLALGDLAAQLRKIADRIAEHSRVLPTMDRFERASFEAATATECGLLADALHQVRQYYEARRRETSPDAPTHRDFKLVRKGSDFMTTMRIVCLALGGSLLAMAGMAQFIAHWPNAAVALLVAGTGLSALATNLPGGQSVPLPKDK